MIVKSLIEEGSTGISEASVVYSDDKLHERLQFIHRTVGDAIVEQYIDGRELYGSVMGNLRLAVFPPWELKLGNLRADAPRIATRRIKWDVGYQERHEVSVGPAEVSDEIMRQYVATSKRIYKALSLSGYARIDYRLDAQGNLWFLEANPNPDIAEGDEFASACEARGMSYHAVLARILHLARRR